MTPDFPAKNQILFDKVMLIIRQFFEYELGKMSGHNEKKISDLENEKNEYISKISELNNGMNLMNSKNSDTINKLNDELSVERKRTKELEDKLILAQKQNKIDKENLEKEFNSRKSVFDDKNTEFLNIKRKYEDEIKAKDEQILIMKLNNDKIMSLNDQKLNYYENEINTGKDKYNKLAENSKTKKISLIKKLSY